MCFPKAKLPPKTQEDIELEKDLKDQRAARKREVANELSLEKEAQTESTLMRLMGMTGNRSLITGSRGGAGFLGAGSGRVTGRGPQAKAPQPTAPAPSAASVWSGMGKMGGYTSGIYGGLF